MKNLQERNNMLKSTHVFLKNLLKPKKSNNTLFLYQRTIAVSLWIIIILGVASIGIEVVNSSNHWIIFIQNGMVGIACSAVVVVVTVYLQFKTEQGKNIETHNKCLYQLLTCINDCLFLWLKDKSASFHCVSIIRMMKNKIVSLVEYWSEDGAAPQWRKEMNIGKPIEKEHSK